MLNASVPAAKALLGKYPKNGGFGKGKVENFGCGFENLGWYEERKLGRVENGGVKGLEVCSDLICKTVYGWREPISPHLAAEREGATVEDSKLLEMLKRGVQNEVEEGADKDAGVMCVIETAGGVASPGPSGTLQCDLYRCVILVYIHDI